MKKSEIPSIPKVKFKFEKGIHNNLLTNWKEPVDLLKKTHKNKERCERNEIFRHQKHENEIDVDIENETEDQAEEGIENETEESIENETEESIENETEESIENETEESIENETEDHIEDEHDDDD